MRRAQKQFLLLASLLVLHYPSAQAQSDCATTVAGYVPAYQASNDASTLISKLTISGGATCLVDLILKQTTSTDKIQISLPQLAAAFQQKGSGIGSGGSTNLVSKGATAKVLATAAEFGGLTESTSNQTVTFSGTLAGIPTMLGQKGLLPVCSPVGAKACIALTSLNALSRFSYSIAFNTTQNSPSITGIAGTTPSQPATFTANDNTLSSATARAVIINGQEPSQKSILDALQKIASKDALAVQADAVKTARQQFASDCHEDSPGPEVTQWRKNTLAALKATRGTAEAKQVWNNSATGLVAALQAECPAEYLKDARDYAKAFSSSQLASNSFYEALRAAPMLTLEYDYNSPANQPSNSTVRLIGQINKKGWTGTLNAAGSFYNSKPSSTIPDAGTVRDFQVSGEAAYNFNQLITSALLGDSTFSLAYYYQDQTSPAILNATPTIISGLPSTATQVFAKRGVINIAQAKFAFIPRNSSINIPVSVTWSNRTELVTNSVWRGQVGISYNFDSIFSASKK